MLKIEVLSRSDLKKMLLDAMTDSELQTLIDTLVDERTYLTARAIVAPACVEDRAQALAVEVTLRDFRREQERRATMKARG